MNALLLRLRRDVTHSQRVHPSCLFNDAMWALGRYKSEACEGVAAALALRALLFARVAARAPQD